MKYISTRGAAPVLDFPGALMAGLARDGGLYVPETWPGLHPDQIAALAGRSYTHIAASIMAHFTGSYSSKDELHTEIEAAYAGFAHPATAPLIQIGDNLFVLELFHGPTLAFKDFAMQVLARLMDNELRRQGARTTVVGATSGDTGAAAIDAFKGRDATDVFILYPHGRVSEVQRRQMTTIADTNVHALAVEGSFDDCQSIVKSLFNRTGFRDRYGLSAVNSINWARIVARIPYYFSAAMSLGAPHRAVSFAVPTGNFGDIFAGFAAFRMGLPVHRLIIATNENDILVRALGTGMYQPRGVVPTTSPSMDIQVSSNFERLLFEASGRDSGLIRDQMTGLTQHGAFHIPHGTLHAIRAVFTAARTTEAQVMQTISSVQRATGYLADPHTAVAIHAAQAHLAREPETAPVVVLATAHPAKFPDAIQHATGTTPAVPERLHKVLRGTERFSVLPNNTDAVAELIVSHTRAKQLANGVSQ